MTSKTASQKPIGDSLATGEAVGLGEAAGAVVMVSGVLVVVPDESGVAVVAGVLLTRGAGAEDVVFAGVLIVTFVVFEPPAGVLREVEPEVELLGELVARGAGTVRVVFVVVLRSVVVEVGGTTIVRLTTLGDG